MNTEYQPLVSCLMPTFNRCSYSDGHRLIEEAIYSFEQQTYKHKELIILNDTPGQLLILPPKYAENNRVTLINYDRRFETLGDKCNALISLARGDYVTRWDDDDISLPNRLTDAVNQLNNGAVKVLEIGGYWWLDRGVYQPCVGRYGFQQDLYDYSVIAAVKYRRISNGEDQAIRRDCCAAVNTDQMAQYLPEPANFGYIYRWSDTNNYHLSSSDLDTESKYRQLGRTVIKTGHVNLNPKWYSDYSEVVKTCLAQL